ncbi:hypothetical protein SAMN03159341_101599 [Paenibacillus sp. 1_12]|uniref:hypothetical protein n=1 Tax=Paenibacillus sp. 1_12 TaxID=1566278 RepID=UPI0008E7B6E7|nr:hypothetical protein [Paenibacillus sp. 1_12]SFK79391.1 hypothetical protein SAMN03159341_101599 [Paenibacillus sp. 1_12]
MSKVFVEYHILPQHRSVYSHWIQIVSDKCPELELLEGVDQPGLFIEVWSGWSRETYLQMKQMRRSGTNSLAGSENEAIARYRAIEWQSMDPWIQGGVSKINIWHFEKVR